MTIGSLPTILSLGHAHTVTNQIFQKLARSSFVSFESQNSFSVLSDEKPLSHARVPSPTTWVAQPRETPSTVNFPKLRVLNINCRSLALDEKSDLRMPQTQFKHLEPPKFIRVSIHLQLIRENLPCICTYENIMV